MPSILSWWPPAYSGTRLKILGNGSDSSIKIAGFCDKKIDKQMKHALKTALGQYVGPSAGLRIRLHLDAPELVGVAWEVLCDPSSLRFPALSEETPLVRYLDLADPSLRHFMGVSAHGSRW